MDAGQQDGASALTGGDGVANTRLSHRCGAMRYAYCALRALLLLFHSIEPRANPGHDVVVPLQHLDGPAQPALRIGEPHLARFLAQLGRQPHAVMAPDAGALQALRGLPRPRVDVSCTP